MWFLISRAVSRSASNSGSAATARARRAMNCGRELASAFCKRHIGHSAGGVALELGAGGDVHAEGYLLADNLAMIAGFATFSA